MICRLSDNLTGSAMKGHNFSKAATMAALFFTTSCIFDAPDDQFYRTLWTTDETPLEGLMIEFKCEGYISASTETDSCGLLGTYHPNGATACFSNLNVYFDTYTIAIDEAQRSKDIMLISWHFIEISPEAEFAHDEAYARGISYTTSFNLVTRQ